MVKTAEEEAWGENFRRDVNKMFNEIVVVLNKQMSQNNTFSVESDWYGGDRVVLKDNSFAFKISPSDIQYNPKVKWTIVIIYKYGVVKGRGIDYWDNDKRILVPVSHRETYTPKELERAKNSVLVKIFEALKKA